MVRSTPDRACGRQGSSAGGGDCTRRLENAHRTVFRELLYPWHPWFGLQVAVHEAIEKTDGIVLRCTLSGSEVDRWLEVPAWMFERAANPNQPKVAQAPFASMSALSALADLLRQSLTDRPTPQNAPLSGTSRSSHDQNRREDHEHAKFGCSDGAPQAASVRAGRKASADRPVRRSDAGASDDCTNLARPADRDAKHADKPDGAVDPGAPAGKVRRLAEGDRS